MSYVFLIIFTITGEISTAEMLEVQTINATAPWILISELKNIMTHTEGVYGVVTAMRWWRLLCLSRRCDDVVFVLYVHDIYVCVCTCVICVSIVFVWYVGVYCQTFYFICDSPPLTHDSLIPHLGNKFIINVSAMEGQFYRYKTCYHPHTNMAKAALNMLTRTTAGQFAFDKIFMNAVDTGWITDERPYNLRFSDNTTDE